VHEEPERGDHALRRIQQDDVVVELVIQLWVGLLRSNLVPHQRGVLERRDGTDVTIPPIGQPSLAARRFAAARVKNRYALPLAFFANSAPKPYRCCPC